MHPQANQYGRFVVQLIVAQTVLYLIAHIGMYTLHHLAHQLLGTELQYFIGHIHLVNKIIEAVQTEVLALFDGSLIMTVAERKYTSGARA